MSSLRVERISHRQLHSICLRVDDGECVSLSGPSGSGKSLLLRAIADLDEANGEVWLGELPRSGFTAPEWRRSVMYFAAESHWWAEHVRDHAPSWQSEHLEMLGFTSDVLNWEIQRLSSGERQRLALARGLAYTPAVLLLDEPTANLDQANTAHVEQLVDHWRAAHGGCVLWVSHDPAQRERIATRHFTINAGTLNESCDD